MASATRTFLEPVSRIEPAILETPGEPVGRVALELAAAAAGLGRGIEPVAARRMRAMMRIIEAHYSNLIEGRELSPDEIGRAVAGNVDEEGPRRSLQLEAIAHERLQAEIDARAAEGRLPAPASPEFILWLHREFYRDAPDEILRIEGAGREFMMEPGAWRSKPEHEVAVGRHLPPSSDRVPDFMAHFAKRYDFSRLDGTQRILAVAAAHHRFSFIHPFPDGNGRISRFMSRAMAYEAGIGGDGLWSISRGLARGFDGRSDYRTMMDHADMTRQGDLDGRGNLSMRALQDYVLWFLKVALAEVTFMSDLLKPVREGRMPMASFDGLLARL